MLTCGGSCARLLSQNAQKTFRRDSNSLIYQNLTLSAVAMTVVHKRGFQLTDRPSYSPDLGIIMLFPIWNHIWLRNNIGDHKETRSYIPVCVCVCVWGGGGPFLPSAWMFLRQGDPIIAAPLEEVFGPQGGLGKKTNKTYLVTFHKCIMVSLWTFQRTPRTSLRSKDISRYFKHCSLS